MEWTINLLTTMCVYSQLSRSSAQTQFPPVNCPNIFQYSQDTKMGGYFGRVKVQQDGSSVSELQVNMTMNTQVPVTTNIKISLLSQQNEIIYGSDINYAIQFPLQDVLPKLTLIKFNNKVLCEGEPDPLEPGIIQTSMWAKSIVTTFSGPVQNLPVTEKPGNVLFSIGVQPQLKFEIPNNPFIPSGTAKPSEIPPTRQTITTTTTTVKSVTRTTTSASRILDQCGTTKVSHLLIGGEDIGPGDFPWLSAIIYRQKSDYKFHCTGNLISDRHVLTAGHCVRYHNAPLFDNEDLIVVLGKLNIENWASGGIIRNAQRVVSHPNYKHDTADYDIAMIVLNDPIRIRPVVRPICLWDGSENLDEIVGSLGTVVGWGKQDEGDAVSSLARKIEMRVVSQENCLRSQKALRKYMSERTFCAKNNGNNSGPCIGDSGAGFMIKSASNSTWFLRGLVGFSIKSQETICDLKSYTVFIDVAKIRTWIEDEMTKDLDN